MHTLACGLHSRIVALCLLSVLGIQPEAHATTIKTIYDFDQPSRLESPDGPLIADAAGNLYGVTNAGGTYGHGTVYRLSPPPVGDNVWRRTTLHSFSGIHTDGAGPSGTLALDAAGNIYGTGMGVGRALRNGFIFKLSPPQLGETVWTESVLHRFVYPGPYETGANIVIDSHGNLFGIGPFGTSNDGFVFELSPPSAGHTDWHLKILHEFKGPDGIFNYYGEHSGAQPALMVDTAGVLYGAAPSGGANGYGTVFQLTPPASGHTVWKAKVLYNFRDKQGGAPTGPVIADSNGALYGSLGQQGFLEKVEGRIFKLTPPGAGHTVWTESTVFNFPQVDRTGGLQPGGSLAFDSSGALYGETYYGGTDDNGVAFKLTPPTTEMGPWSEAVISSLGKRSNSTIGGLVADQSGNIFGVQAYSKSDDRASVFEITP